MALLSPVLVLGAMELTLRGFGFGLDAPWYYDREVSGLAFYPDQTHTMVHRDRRLADATLNEAGYRGPWFTSAKTAGVVRIALVGDSWTFGWAAEDDQTYPQQVRSLLDQLDVAHETVNFGVPGFNAENELKAYRRDVRDFDADIVVVGVGANDLEPTMSGIAYRGGRVGQWADRSALYDAFKQATGYRGHFVQSLVTPAHSALVDGWERNRAEILACPDEGVGLTYYQAWRESFDGLLAGARASGSQVLVLAFPGKGQYRRAVRARQAGEARPWVPRSELGWQRVIRTHTQEAGGVFLDLLELFAESPRNPYGEADRGHPSPAGYELISRAVVVELQRQGWISPQ